MAMELKPLFAIPVVKVHLPETEDLKRRFLPEMLRRYEDKRYARPPQWETDRVHTSFGAARQDQVIDTLPDAYARLVRQFVNDDKANLSIWHNVYWTEEEYQERHHHIPYHFSFIHFLAFDKAEHRPPIFYDPSRMIKAFCSHDGIPPAYWSESAVIEVEEGDALIFPSYLEHHVPPGKYTKPRVTVSINARLPRDIAPKA